MIFHPGTAVEAITRNHVKYANAWYKGNIVRTRARSYFICFDGYDERDSTWVEERDIRFPLEIPVFSVTHVPLVGDRVEVEQKLSKEPAGWFEAIITCVYTKNRTIKVQWINPYMEKKKKTEIKWHKARLIARGKGYKIVEELETIAPHYDEQMTIDLENIPDSAKEAWNYANQHKKSQKHTCEFISCNLTPAERKDIKAAVIDAVVRCTHHPSLEIGLIENHTNPAKRFAFGSEVHGLFTNSFIPKHTVLGLYTGEIRALGDFEDTVTLTNEADKVYSMDLSYSNMWAGDDPHKALTIDACEKRNVMSFINDYRIGFSNSSSEERERKLLKTQLGKMGIKTKVSYWQPREQNAMFVEVVVDKFPFMIVVSTKDINGGEEILADYGEDFWRNFEYIIERKISLMHLNQEFEAKSNKLKHDMEQRDQQLKCLDKQLSLREEKIATLQRSLAEREQELKNKNEEIADLNKLLHQILEANNSPSSDNTTPSCNSGNCGKNSGNSSGGNSGDDSATSSNTITSNYNITATTMSSPTLHDNEPPANSTRNNKRSIMHAKDESGGMREEGEILTKRLRFGTIGRKSKRDHIEQYLTPVEGSELISNHTTTESAEASDGASVDNTKGFQEDSLQEKASAKPLDRFYEFLELPASPPPVHSTSFVKEERSRVGGVWKAVLVVVD